jgi:hypothetical protein
MRGRGTMRNLNYEDDTRHDISNKSLKRLEGVMHSQDDFGIKKYGKPLNSRMNYNWLEMAREELADFLKYLECEEERKRDIIDILRMALNSNDPKSHIKGALMILEVGGTGK